MTKLKKQDFVKKYNYSPSTYQRNVGTKKYSNFLSGV